jgi:hypothetical protein
MKLLFCPHCDDVFKLDKTETRSCKCGRVRGKYKSDGSHAVTNGCGVPVAINNRDLFMAATGLSEEDSGDMEYEEYQKKYKIKAWLRPHEGKGNPRSIVDEDL